MSALRGLLIERHGATCQYCKRPGTPARDPDGRFWVAEHMIPHSRGGSDADANRTLACTSCNSRKKCFRFDEPWQERYELKRYIRAVNTTIWRIGHRLAVGDVRCLKQQRDAARARIREIDSLVVLGSKRFDQVPATPEGLHDWTSFLLGGGLV